jgi:hypothetical protein
VRHVLAETPDQLTAAVAEVPQAITVVEVPVDRSTHRTERDRLRGLAAKALRQ